MRHRRLPIFPKYAVCLLAILWLAAGCAPKRVVNGVHIAGKPSQPKSSQPKTSPPKAPAEFDEFGLPRSRERGKSGTKASKPVPDNVAFGLKVATLAQEQLGKPYKWGAHGPDRFDCSGLVYYVMGNMGVDMPRVSQEQSTHGRKIQRSQLEPGDLLFFATSGRRIDHVGIYVGNNRFIHAPRKHVPVRTDSLNSHYWSERLQVARRIRS